MNFVVDANQIWTALVTAAFLGIGGLIINNLSQRGRTELLMKESDRKHEENKVESAKRHVENQEKFEKIGEVLEKILDPEEGKLARKSEVKEAHRRMWVKFDEHDETLKDHDDRIRRVEKP